MEFYIREAMENDNEALIELLAEVQQLHIKNKPDFHLDVKVTFEQVYRTNIYEDPRYKVFVAVDSRNNQVVGYILLRVTDSKPQIAAQNAKKSVYIHELSVSKEYQRRNIGNQLFEAAIGYSRMIGAESIELGVWEFNQDAISFYEKMGMKTILRRMEMML